MNKVEKSKSVTISPDSPMAKGLFKMWQIPRGIFLTLTTALCMRLPMGKSLW